MLDGIMGTLDQQVDDKKSMMRANPGMQGTVGKDLIGVMALQKLQKEKQAAENELMLAQQNNPATIKEQLEREVAGLTQNEMATQTAGILNQRQMQQQGKQQQRPQQQQQRPQQQQQRPQGIQQAARPPMGGAPRPMPQGAGIAGAPRPPMMAQGGIVGFNDGGQPKGKLRSGGYSKTGKGGIIYARRDYINKLEELYRNNDIGKNYLDRERKAALAGERDSQISSGTQINVDDANRVASQLGINVDPKLQQKAVDLVNTGGTPRPKEVGVNNVASALGGGKPASPFGFDADAEKAKLDAVDLGGEGGPKVGGGPEVGGGPKVGGGTDLASLLEGKLNTGVTEEQKATIGQSQASDRLDSDIKTTLGSMSKGDDPLAAMKAAQAEGDTRYNKDYDVTGIKAKRQAQDDEMARQLTPEAQRQQRLRAGAVQRGGLAGARAIAGNRADARRMKMYKDSADNYAADMKANVEKLKAVDTTAARIMEQIATDRNTAVQVFGNLSIADQQAVTAAEDRFQAQNQAAMEGLLAGMKIESEAALMRSIQDSKDSAELRSTWEAIRTNREDQLTAYRESSDYRMLDEAERPAEMEKRRLSLIKNFENLETEIIRQLQALNPALDYSAFLKDSGGGNKDDVDTGAGDDILSNL